MLINLKNFYCDNNFLTLLEGIENFVNLKNLYCSNNELTSLEHIKNLVGLEYLYFDNNKITSLYHYLNDLNNLKELCCKNNFLTSLELITNLTKLMKNNESLINKLEYDTIDHDDFIELEELFDNLLQWDIINEIKKFDDHICEIEKMIVYFNGFEKCILK
jgi:Leucine-rich repeat (LRR) protein